MNNFRVLSFIPLLVISVTFAVYLQSEFTSAAPASVKQHVPRNKTNVLHDETEEGNEETGNPVAEEHELPQEDEEANNEFDACEPAQDFQSVGAMQADGELGNLFDGDIMLSPGTAADEVQHNGIKGENYRWPQATVPYVISQGFSNDEMSRIKAAMGIYHQKTCIKWIRRRKTDTVYVRFQNLADKGCTSYVGRQTGEQALNLGPGCFSSGTILHEMMHAVGFFHEQSRMDRDQFISINWNNIPKNLHFAFQKLSEEVNFGTRYDYDSVMHYGRTAFAIDSSKDTITPKDPNAKIGVRDAFSRTDIVKLRKMYKC